MKNTVVKIDNLVKRYGELVALDHFSLEISEGEIFGLLGPNGSGKTTTINCLLSLLSFDKGNIEIFGKKMAPTSYDIKKDIGVIMQNVAVFDELTVYENIDYFCGLYISDKELRKQYVDEAVSFVGLEDFLKFRPKKLSGGLLRRLNIACGIAHKPKLIILDEPTVAVDPQSRNRILEGIEELNRNGATVIYTSHYMEEVEQICTRIAIMDKGRKIAEGTKDELKSMIRNTETVNIELIGLTDDIKAKIAELPHVYSTEYDGTKLTVCCSGGKHNLIRILGVLQENDLGFGRVYSELPTLNDVFLEITGKALRDDADSAKKAAPHEKANKKENFR
ncbi:MAG: ABC transporter ATP-binding protein [Ruminiclostridium sp.]|nr:ABC transporter ATP-binding protein [Ruminiclostridium sp.]